MVKFYDSEGALVRVTDGSQYAIWSDYEGRWERYRGPANTTYELTAFQRPLTEAQAKAQIVAANGSAQDLYKAAE